MSEYVRDKEPHEDALKCFNAEISSDHELREETWNKFYHGDAIYQNRFLREYNKLREKAGISSQ